MKLMWSLAVILATLFPGLTLHASQDILLRKVIQAYQIAPHEPSGRSLGAKERLGQALFFDPFVSGPKQIACAACHVRSLGAGDNLRLAVGLGATGVSKERLASKSAFIVPRNALPFFNRGSDAFVALFWDGRVQRGPDGGIESPLGKRLPTGFDSPLAAAAVFPLAEPDEMLGRARNSNDRTFHGELVSQDVNSSNLQERTLSVFNNVVTRLLSPPSTKGNPVVTRYRALFESAYPGVQLSDFRVNHIGNSLAAYIGAAFELQSASWDKYVKGNTAALTNSQKEGALLFFGKGRCSACHSGTQFSDFRFHGLAIPQMRIGKSGRYIDYGRGSATSRGKDRFTFRTPPLRNVVSTSPWGHNGIFTSLDAVIEHHVNPVPALYAAQQEEPEEGAHAGRLLGFRSPILAEIAPLTKKEIELLIEFLRALSSPTVMTDDIAIPSDVPSGRRDFLRP